MKMVEVVLFILFCWLVFAWFEAKWFYEVANEKGYNDKKYLWICFLFSIVGYLLVIALPDRGNAKNTTVTTNISTFSDNNDLPDL